MYRTTFKIVMLSEEPVRDISLADVWHEMTEGHCSGVFSQESEEKLTPAEMAKALIEQGSDPEFFGIDAEGNKVDD